MVMLDNCDPSVEQCNVPDEIVRPPIDDFRALPFIFAWFGVVPFIALLLAAVFQPVRFDWDMTCLAQPLSAMNTNYKVRYLKYRQEKEN